MFNRARKAEVGKLSGRRVYGELSLSNDIQMKALGPLRQAVDLDVWTGILSKEGESDPQLRNQPWRNEESNGDGNRHTVNSCKGTNLTHETAHKNAAERRSLHGEPGRDPVLGGAGFYDAQFCKPRSG